MSGAAAKQMPAEFIGLDTNASADGRFYSAHVRVTLARNLNKVYGQGRRLINQGFPYDAAGTSSVLTVGAAAQWVALPPWRVDKTPGARFAQIAIRGMIANTKTVVIQWSSNARVFNPDANSADNVTLTGDGTFKRYPTAGYWSLPLDPGSEDEITLHVYGTDDGTTTDNLGNSNGVIDNYQQYRDSSVIADAGADWDNVTPGTSNHYIRIVDTTLAIARTPPLRPIAKLNSGPCTSIEVYPPVSGPIVWNSDKWQLRKAVVLHVQNVSAYEREPASEAEGL